ncbi:MAG: ATP-binding cassette domain-containing protein [Flavipsychrobacter sp.]
MSHILEADSVMLRFGDRAILSDIYLKSETGRITGLVGNNGSGKSSLMKVIFGVLHAECKSVRVDGKYLAQPYLVPDAVNYLPQQNFLPQTATVNKICRQYEVSLVGFKQSFDVAIKGSDHVADLHGSTRRLLELFLLIKRPTKFTLLDEPFTHLSPILVQQLQMLLLEEKRHKGFVLTDHNFHSLKHIADDLYFLNNGVLKHRNDVENIETYRSLFEL